MSAALVSLLFATVGAIEPHDRNVGCSNIGENDVREVSCAVVRSLQEDEA